MNALLEALQFAGNVLDTPGSIARGLLAGDPTRALRGIVNPDDRVGGREMLQNWGMVGENQDGLDWGDVAGFGAEVLADPLNLVGGAGLGKILKNPKMVLQKGPHYITDDVLQNTKVLDEFGQPRRLYHGTASSYDWPDVSRVDPGENLFGRGFYMTKDPRVSSSLNNPHLNDYMIARGLGYETPHDWFDLISERADPSASTVDSQLLDYLGVNRNLDNVLDNGSYAEVRASVPLKKRAVLESRAADEEAGLADHIRDAAEDGIAGATVESKIQYPDVPDDFIMDNKDSITKKVHEWLAIQNEASVDDLTGIGEDYETIRNKIRMIDSAYDAASRIDRLPPVNTRINYADVRNPFDMDAPASPVDAGLLAESLKSEYMNTPQWAGQPLPGLEEVSTMPLAEIYNELLDVSRRSNFRQGYQGSDLYNALVEYLGKSGTNPLLQSAGFDGITHIGGNRAGRGKLNHRVWIPFSENQLYLPFMPPRVPTYPGANRLAATLAGYNAARPWGE